MSRGDPHRHLWMGLGQTSRWFSMRRASHFPLKTTTPLSDAFRNSRQNHLSIAMMSWANCSKSEFCFFFYGERLQETLQGAQQNAGEH